MSRTARRRSVTRPISLDGRSLRDGPLANLLRKLQETSHLYVTRHVVEKPGTGLRQLANLSHGQLSARQGAPLLEGLEELEDERQILASAVSFQAAWPILAACGGHLFGLLWVCRAGYHETAGSFHIVLRGHRRGCPTAQLRAQGQVHSAGGTEDDVLVVLCLDAFLRLTLPPRSGDGFNAPPSARPTSSPTRWRMTVLLPRPAGAAHGRHAGL